MSSISSSHLPTKESWLLPEGVDDVLPPRSYQLEFLRRQLLDNFYCWGYDLVSPPIIEYLDALLVGTGDRLADQTTRCTDLLSGKALGVRADMTTQVARIDRSLQQLKDQPDNLLPSTSRYCYAGPVFHAKAQSRFASRNLYQVGAECFGSHAIESDKEVLSLMIHSLQICQAPNLTIELGHADFYRLVFEEAFDLNHVSSDVLTEIHDAIRSKSQNKICRLASQHARNEKYASLVAALPSTRGPINQLMSKTKSFIALAPSLGEALGKIVTDLDKLASSISNANNITILFDLGELNGYHYHNGITFNAYSDSQGSPIARGGRYNHFSPDFKSRPATGFAMDLSVLLQHHACELPIAQTCISAPAALDSELSSAINKLRASGKRVVIELDQHSLEKTTHRLVKNEQGKWEVSPAL